MEEQKDAQNAPAPTFDGGDFAIMPGLVVRYTTRLGETQPASIESIEEDTLRATLSANVDGRWSRFAGVPHSADGGSNTWDYAPKEG